MRPVPLPEPAAAVPFPTPRVSHGLAAFVLALLLSLQPLSTDVYLPALPMLKSAFGATMGATQLTMSALILAFGVAQLVWGPVADRVGRRPVLLLGLVFYTAAGVGGALAPDIGWLVLWRVLQGAGLAAAVVCARAILRDLYEPHEGARVMALALSGLGVVAIVGPILGGLVTAAFGWRAALGLVALAGGSALVFLLARWPETLRQPERNATRLGPLLNAWLAIGRNRTFVAWALLVTCTYGGLFTLLAGSSFVYIGVLGLSPTAYGAAMALGSLHYLAGTFVCRRWIARHGMQGAVRRGAAFTLAGGAAAALLALGGVETVWSLLAPQCVYAFGHGIHQPCGQAGAVGPFPRQAGAASALAGFALALVAFGIGVWLGSALDASVLPVALSLGLWAVLTSTVAWTLVQRTART